MEIIPRLLRLLPGRFSRELGITVEAGPAERQKWLLAAILFGARLSGVLAARTYKVFEARGVVTPEAVLAQGWDNLVMLLDEGGYTRYDFKTATKLLRVMEALTARFQALKVFPQVWVFFLQSLGIILRPPAGGRRRPPET